MHHSAVHLRLARYCKSTVLQLLERIKRLCCEQRAATGWTGRGGAEGKGGRDGGEREAAMLAAEESRASRRARRSGRRPPCRSPDGGGRGEGFQWHGPGRASSTTLLLARGRVLLERQLCRGGAPVLPGSQVFGAGVGQRPESPEPQRHRVATRRSLWGSSGPQVSRALPTCAGGFQLAIF